jgi:hypothetical protein
MPVDAPYNSSAIPGIGHVNSFHDGLFRSRVAEWLFPPPGPQRQVFVAGVEEKATFKNAKSG